MRGAVVVVVAVALFAGLGPVVDASAADPTVTVDVSPGAPEVGGSVTVSGDVTDASGQPVANAPLTARRTDSAGDHPLMVDMANGSGHYSFTDVPTVHGDVTWTVTWQSPGGDVSGHQTVTVTRRPTSLTLTVSDTTVRTGTTVDLTAHLDSPTTDRTVGIYARPYGQPRELVKRGTVDATSGDLQATYDVDRGTTFIARFAGDETYAPAKDRRHVDVVARLADTLAGSYRTAHGYQLFHVGDDATVKAHLHPELDQVCLYFRAQRRRSGAWRTTAVSDCVQTDSRGRATSKLRGYTALVDKPYRVRAEWRGGPGALADNGHWRRLRFRG